MTNAESSLTAHSVVRGADGGLIDITPLETKDPRIRAAMCFIPHLGDEQSFFSMKALGININCRQTSKEGKARMSIKATAVVKKESKVDPEKPQDKVHYVSLSVLNEDGKGYGLPRYLGEFRDIAVLLKREAGVTHEQLHERFAAYERGEEISFPLTLESDEAINNLGFDPTGAADS